MRELRVVLYNFRYSGLNEEARWEVTSQETKKLQRQLLPLMRKRDELWNPRSSHCCLRSTQGLGCSWSCWQVGWQAPAADFLKSKSARFWILSLGKVPFFFFLNQPESSCVIFSCCVCKNLISLPQQKLKQNVQPLLATWKDSFLILNQKRQLLSARQRYRCHQIVSVFKNSLLL